MRFFIAENMAGLRLDKALTHALPDASLRHRRRLIETGQVLIDGQKQVAGYKVVAGQEVEVARPVDAPVADGVRLLHRQGDFAAVVKPAGMHAAHICGTCGSSVEQHLSALFAGETPILLNRLDLHTSGFVLVAFSQAAADGFRELERAGQVRKQYVAVVEGCVEPGQVIKTKLDMANRSKVKLLDEPDPDPARHTSIVTADYDEATNTSRLSAIIARGARHQIRVHLASIGHPIVGDALYGNSDDSLLLHHSSIEFKDFSCTLEPGWNSFP